MDGDRRRPIDSPVVGGEYAGALGPGFSINESYCMGVQSTCQGRPRHVWVEIQPLTLVVVVAGLVGLTYLATAFVRRGRRAEHYLAQFTEPAALLGPDGQTVPLPLEAFQVLVKVVESMRAGKAITVAPVDQLLTTQEAANFLGISRPTLVKLLEQGQIVYEQPAAGRHRRVRLMDVLEYQRRKRVERRAALDGLTEDAAAAGLYDGEPDYAAALRVARRRRAS